GVGGATDLAPWTRDKYRGDLSHRHPKAPEKSRGESQGNHPAATVQKPQEAAVGSRLRPSRSSHGPETLGHITPQAEARQSPGVQAPASSHRESRCRYPIVATSPWTQKVVPSPPGLESRLPQHLNLTQQPAEQHTTSPPNNLASASSPSPSPSVPNRSSASSQGPEPQKEPLEEGHHSTPRTGHPANPTPKPRRYPRMPDTHPPARYTPPYQAARPAPPPKRSHISINNAHCPAKDTRARALPPPNRRTGHQSQGPRSKEIQAIPREQKSQTTPKTRTPTPA
ncbi:hypothetical protein CRENBAI_001166, partial [Crenichthys baileyi]